MGKKTQISFSEIKQILAVKTLDSINHLFDLRSFRVGTHHKETEIT